jgi:hypothetical protein
MTPSSPYVKCRVPPYIRVLGVTPPFFLTPNHERLHP